MKERFTEPVIQLRELYPERDVMDAPLIISGESGVESRFIADDVHSNYTAWKGKQY